MVFLFKTGSDVGNPSILDYSSKPAPGVQPLQDSQKQEKVTARSTEK